MLLILHGGIASRAAWAPTPFAGWKLRHPGTLLNSAWGSITWHLPKHTQLTISEFFSVNTPDCTGNKKAAPLRVTRMISSWKLLQSSWNTGCQSQAQRWPYQASHVATFRNFWLWRIPKIGREFCLRFLGKSLAVPREKGTSQLVTLRDAAC